jgi:peroxiredoxin Q/BCP
MVKEGDIAPDISLPYKNGVPRRLFDILGEKWTVVYFYPRDGTAGCTAQACSFRDAYQDLSDEGATVIGISSDTSNSHSSFAEKYNLPFILLSDKEGKAREEFGVPKSLGLLPGRVTYLIDNKKVVRLVFNSQTRATEHVKKVLEYIGSND